MGSILLKEVTRREALFGLGATAALGFGLFLPKVSEAISALTWHKYSQSKRNGLIIAEAFEDLYSPPRVNPYGKDVECKGWVQYIVSRASDGAVWPPRNAPDEYGDSWKGCPNKKLYVGRRSTGIHGVQPGDIIQMHYQTARKQPAPINAHWIPHTAIVSRIIGSGFAMEWIDNNWSENDRKVRKHSVTFETFFDNTRDVGLDYNVYYIL
jgi:hypothetical protein